MKKFTLILLTIFALLIPQTAFAFNIPDSPENGFYDPNNYISTETENKLVDFNEKHKSTDHTQLGIAIVDTLNGEDIEKVANEISKSWQIGYENSNRGALVLIAINDRKFRIETSNELRKVITDWEALDILNSTKSEMKNQNYNAAVQNIISQIDNEIGKEPTESNQQKDSSSSLGILAPFLVLIPLFIISDLQDYIEKRRKIKEKREFEKRSQFDYTGNDKLYPEDEYFNENCWTNAQREEYIKEKRKKEKEDYSRRSAFNYTGNDKLRPGDKNFDDTTWTQAQILMYYSMLSSSNESSPSSSSSYSSYSSSSSSDDSSSPWSSSSWSGGGFDGGGASGGW